MITLIALISLFALGHGAALSEDTSPMKRASLIPLVDKTLETVLSPILGSTEEHKIPVISVSPEITLIKHPHVPIQDGQQTLIKPLEPQTKTAKAHLIPAFRYPIVMLPVYDPTVVPIQPSYPIFYPYNSIAKE